MSAPKTITVECEACDMRVELPGDVVGELYALDFTERHAHTVEKNGDAS